ncbi:MAG: hypothetical protein PHX68_00625 [Alphaproteobacteria bacterium]|nr:hypothetical protein [Alphaproteobacteria bacterium]
MAKFKKPGTRVLSPVTPSDETPAPTPEQIADLISFLNAAARLAKSGIEHVRVEGSVSFKIGDHPAAAQLNRAKRRIKKEHQR